MATTGFVSLSNLGTSNPLFGTFNDFGFSIPGGSTIQGCDLKATFDVSSWTGLLHMTLQSGTHGGGITEVDNLTGLTSYVFLVHLQIDTTSTMTLSGFLLESFHLTTSISPWSLLSSVQANVTYV